MGRAALDTAQTWDAAYREGLVTETEYRAFAQAMGAVRAAWLRAYQAWQAGEDPAALRRTLLALRQELTLWALRARERR